MKWADFIAYYENSAVDYCMKASPGFECRDKDKGFVHTTEGNCHTAVNYQFPNVFAKKIGSFYKITENMVY